MSHVLAASPQLLLFRVQAQRSDSTVATRGRRTGPLLHAYNNTKRIKVTFSCQLMLHCVDYISTIIFLQLYYFSSVLFTAMLAKEF